MAVAFVTTAGAINNNTEVQSVTIPLALTVNQMVVVFVAVRSSDGTVATVTDTFGDVFTQRASIVAHKEFDYASDQYDKSPLNTDWVECECWTVKAGGTSTSITVTTTAMVKFDVEVLVYTSGSGLFGTATSTSYKSVSSPSVVLATNATSSFVVAGFASPNGLNQAASTGTLRCQETGGTPNSVVALACADNTGANPCTVALTTTNTTVLFGEASGQITIPVPSPYAVCAVEIKA